MKVLWVTGSFYPTNSGGMDTIMHWIALCLKRQNVDLTLLTSNEGTNGLVESNKWVEMDFGNAKYIPTRIHYLPLRLIANAIGALSTHENVHLCNIFYPSSIAVATAAVLRNKKIIWSVHGELDPWAIQHKSYKKKPFLWFINRWLKNRVVFHATCEEEVEYIKAVFGGNVQVLLLPNYILLPPKESVPVKPYLLFVGRIHTKKGVDKLIQALLLSDHFIQSEFTLKIVGDINNEYGQSLVKQVAKLGLNDKVEFLGKKEGREKFQLFAGAYFSLMPSITENFGMVVVESLSQGTPVIASTGTPWEILETSKAGYWTDPDANSIAKNIDDILKLDANDYQAFRENAYRLVYEKYDMEKNIGEWVEAYRKVFAPVREEVLMKTTI